MLDTYSHSTVLCLTCQGYSFTSVSTPPTILARLLAWPQVQSLLVPLEVVVVAGGAVVVVVATGEGVVVEAKVTDDYFNDTIDTFANS